jgi:GMP synthase-like glutamine amidotransferase
MKPILFVRCDSLDTSGLAPDAVRAAGADVWLWESRESGTDRPDLADVNGVVLFGSTYNVEHAEEQPFIKEVRELTLDAVDRGTPFLGVCFGAQVLAWALDAEVGKAPVREVGFEPVHPGSEAAIDPLLAHYRDGDRVFQWHMDTFEPPAGATMLATGDRVHNQAFRVGERTWGVQWHLEVDRPELEQWLDTFSAEGGDLKTEWGKSPDDVRAEADTLLAAHEEKGRELFTRFVEVVRETSR